MHLALENGARWLELTVSSGVGRGRRKGRGMREGEKFLREKCTRTAEAAPYRKYPAKPKKGRPRTEFTLLRPNPDPGRAGQVNNGIVPNLFAHSLGPDDKGRNVVTLKEKRNALSRMWSAVPQLLGVSSKS